MLYDIFGLKGTLMRCLSWARALILLSIIIILVSCSSSPQSATPSVSSFPASSKASEPNIKPTALAGASDLSKPAGGAQHAGSDSAPASVPPAASRPPNPYGPFSLNEHIFFADVIAIVRPISVKSGFLTMQRTAEHNRYRSVTQSRYEVIEYFKGDGDSEIVVDAKNLYADLEDMSAEQALQTAEGRVATQISNLGGREAVVFFRRLQYPDSVLDTSRKADENQWRLHNAQTGLFSAGGDIGDPSTTFRIASTFIAEDEQTETFSIADLRERIEAMDALLREGEGIEGWEECIRSKLLYANYLRKYRATHGEDPLSTAELGPFPSGQPAGFAAHDAGLFGGRGYYKEWLTGEDARFFQILLLEGGQVITPDYWATRSEITAYDIEIRAMRPLLAGIYEIYRHGQAPSDIPCDFVQPHSTWRFTFEAAEGTLHEAFFDPVNIDDAVGADSANGALEPTDFEHDDREAAIEALRWRDGQVELALEVEDDSPDIASHRMDFIALDGSVALRLLFEDAIEFADEDDIATFVWGVCEQPWQNGDLLMLRIAASVPADGVQATNDLECLATTPEPTPEPVPTVTPEHEPTATPEPAPPATPEPAPTATPEPAPTATPEPEPTATPEPAPTAAPLTTATPEPDPTVTPEPTAAPLTTATPDPEPTATPEPESTAAPLPTATPEPTA